MLYRARFLTEPEVKYMDEKGHALLKSLVKTFPHGVTLADGTFRSAFCTEKPLIQVYVLSVLVFLYIQGPVGRRKIPTNYSWLPGDMRRLGGANTLGTLQMGSDAVLGTGHRRQ